MPDLMKVRNERCFKLILL